MEEDHVMLLFVGVDADYILKTLSQHAYKTLTYEISLKMVHTTRKVDTNLSTFHF